MLDQHTTQLRVRYDECDPMGFVHHSIYLRYFEIARIELFRLSGGNYGQLEQAGIFVVVVHVDCRYMAPAKYDDELAIQVKIDKMTQAKIIHSYSISCGGKELVAARVTLAVIDRQGRLQRIPDEIRHPGGL